jgi:non-specific serine/threonine protein kinase
MEYIQGEELKDKIETTPLSIEDSLAIALQIAGGLQAAHEKGVTHRDIKSANIMFTEKGAVKIMDFGLAKVRGGAKLTLEQSTLGTAPYMSPEQARGEDVDHRTDVFSLGVLLYEMLTGQLPFKGDYQEAIIYSILNEEHEPVTGLRSGVPMDLERIVDKCLQKVPADRYQGANELSVDLRQIEKAELTDNLSTSGVGPPVSKKRGPSLLITGAVLSIVILAAAWYSFFRSGESQPAPDRKMLVVLPFENLGPPEQAYFAAGMTEEITSRLAAVSGLGVISRSSAAQYDRTGKTMQEVASDFGVDYVLDGTVRWNPGADGDNKVRITPQLIGGSDDTQLWSERYDRVLDDIFVVQSEIAAQVVQKLGVTLLVDDQQIIAGKPTENLEAYDYYLRGNDYTARQDNLKDAEIAIQMYEKAVELDPNFAVAYAALSRARIWLHWLFGQIDQVQKAKEALDRAQQLAPDLGETHLASGYYYYYGSRDYDKAMEHFTIVQTRQPNDAEVTVAIGYIRRRQGKWEQAAVQMEQAVALDPRNHLWLSNLGAMYLYMRRYAEAERYLDRAIAVAPDLPINYIDKFHLYLSWLGSTERAEQVLVDAAGRIEREVLDREIWALGRVYVGSDTLASFLDKAETHYYMQQTELAAPYADSARIILEAEIKARPGFQWWHQWLGWAYAYLGRRDDAIREARKAVELLPVSKDAYSGCWMVQSLALLYTVVGEHDAAIEQLEYLLTIPSLISVPRLKFQPVWEPLHQHPRFKQLLEKYGGESQ